MWSVMVGWWLVPRLYIANILRNISIHEQEIPFSTNHNKGTTEGFEHCSFRQKHLAKIINVTDLSGIVELHALWLGQKGSSSIAFDQSEAVIPCVYGPLHKNLGLETIGPTYVFFLQPQKKIEQQPPIIIMIYIYIWYNTYIYIW